MGLSFVHSHQDSVCGRALALASIRLLGRAVATAATQGTTLLPPQPPAAPPHVSAATVQVAGREAVGRGEDFQEVLLGEGEGFPVAKVRCDPLLFSRACHVSSSYGKVSSWQVFL